MKGLNMERIFDLIDKAVDLCADNNNDEYPTHLLLGTVEYRALMAGLTQLGNAVDDYKTEYANMQLLIIPKPKSRFLKAVILSR